MVTATGSATGVSAGITGATGSDFGAAIGGGVFVDTVVTSGAVEMAFGLSTHVVAIASRNRSLVLRDSAMTTPTARGCGPKSSIYCKLPTPRSDFVPAG
jgi:hypothetical protein